MLAKKMIASVFLTLILCSSFLAIETRLVKAAGIIYIRADGSIDPPTAPIERIGDLYILTDNIYDISIVILKDNIVLDGANHTLQGSGSAQAIIMTENGMRRNVTVTNFEIRAFYQAINMNSGTGNKICQNKLISNTVGIYIGTGENNTISLNEITGGARGIWQSSGSTRSKSNISRNILGGSEASIWLEYSSNNTICNNEIIQGSAWGIYIADSSNNTVLKNDIKTANTQGVSITRSSDNIISENNITGSDIGIYVFYGDSNTIRGNSITSCSVGIRFWNSANSNEIVDNRMTNITSYAMYLFAADPGTVRYNLIKGNDIEGCTSGLSLSYADYNTIIENTVVENNLGIYLHFSPNNHLYHNNFVDNANQVSVWSSVNFYWDNGCEGNYWSDYNGTDLDGDGAGDIQYVIDGNNIDRYPLMNYWIPGDVNHNLKVEILDVVKITSCYGCTPSDPEYNPHADIAEPFGKIDILDLVLCTSHYGDKWP